MYQIKKTNEFVDDYVHLKKAGYDTDALKAVVELLAEGDPLPEEYYDHALVENWTGYRECHIDYDWLLIYRPHKTKPLITLTRTGTHSELF
jgi:mRNA interferase YafQ